MELGEVEHHIQQHLTHCPEVTVVADMVKPRGLSNPLLMAFLSVKQGAKIVDVPAIMHEILPGLEEKLAKTLPAYMVPSALVPIEQIPMTATGKTNRRQLRELCGSLTLDELGESRTPTAGKERAPSSEMEK